MNAKKFRQLKDRVDELQGEADRAKGALEQIGRQLEEEGCPSVEAAEKMLKKLEKEEREAEAEFDRERARWEKKWVSKLEDE